MRSQPNPGHLAHPTARVAFRILPLALLPLATGLAGCYSVRVHTVSHTTVVPHVQDATADQLLEQLKKQYQAVHSLSATITIAASEGGAHTGEVKEIPTFSGYLLLAQPSAFRVQLRLPVVLSTALDMTSDGTNFKMYIPPKNQAFEGSETVTHPSRNAFENLRTGFIRDALLIPPVAPEQFVTLTQGSRLLPAPPDRREARKEAREEAQEEPDYDISVAQVKHEHLLERIRVIHISRTSLLPFAQDVYENGKVVTHVEYDHYQKYGDIELATSILITRPVDELKLKLDLGKVTLNPELGTGAFTLKIPETVPVKHME